MNVPLDHKLFDISGRIKTKYLNPKYRYTATAADRDTRALERKYARFARHDDIYNSAVGAYMSVGRAFTSDQLNISEYGERPFYTQPVITVLQELVKPNFFMDVQSKYVETRLPGKEFSFALDFGKPERLGDAEKIIKQYLPDFVMPTRFERADLEGAGNLNLFNLGPRISNLMAVEALSNIVPGYTSKATPNKNAKNDPDGKETNRFKLPKNYKENNYGKIAYVEIIAEFDRAYLMTDSGIRVAAGSEGNLLSGRFKAHVPLKMNLVFRWPWEFAQYVTCAEGKEDFLPFLFYQYTNWHRTAYAGKRTRGGGLSIRPPARLSHLGNISKQIDAEKKAGRIVKPRINEDGFVILGTGEPSKLGEVVWIDPTANRISEYMTEIRSAYNTEEKRIDLSKLKIKGTALFFDAHNEKFVYIREAGSDKSASDVSGIQLLDLTGSLPLDDITIAKRLNERLDADKTLLKDFGTLIYKVLSGEFEGVTITKPLNPQTLKAYGFSDFDARKGRDIIPEMFKDIAEMPDMDLTWGHIGGDRKLKLKSYDSEDIVEGTALAARYLRIQQVRAFANCLKDLSRDLLTNFDKVHVAFSAKVEKWRFILTLITKYAKDDARYQNLLSEGINRNTAREFKKEQVLDLKGRVNVPNLPGITSVMPHQSESLQDLNDKPPMSFIEAVVGGGKTALGLIDALNLLQTGEVKRPLVAVPGHLVKNWATEIRKFSKGEVNVFILTIQTVRRLMQVYKGITNPAAKPDYVFLKKIILACPPNTIFLTNFRFMSIDKEEIVYANSLITRFYSAEFLREMLFDLVTIDESHGVKTIESNQTQGVAIVASVAKYKRLMSGTLVNNTLIDLVGQSAIGNPAALGTKSNFISRYGSSYTGDDDEEFTGEWRPDAASLIIQDMRPYVKRIIHKRDRIAFMLPKSIENFHQVEMTPLQKAFYDAMLDQSFEELKDKNPKLFAKIMDGNEVDEGAITSGLSTHFQAIEEFLCAPDSVPDFLDLEGIEDNDKVSPKVHKIVELLDQHFKGTLDNDGNYVEQPNQHKVIIFGNRRATSAHVFKHLPERYRKIAVRYTADDKMAAQVFELNPKIRILVADGASITSGLNLQFAARMIRYETVWSPGDLEQAYARIWRPNFSGDTRLNVYLDWLVCGQSLDVAKIGRIISKLVEKQKYDRQEDVNFVYNPFIPSDAFMNMEVGTTPMHEIVPESKSKQPIAKMLDTLPLIKMNHSTLQDLREMGQLKEYFANYALVNDYEEQQFERQKKEGLQQLIPIPDECRTTIEGSQKLAYQSRVPGMNPEAFDPGNHFGYKPISIIESTIALNEIMGEDEENETYVEVNPVRGGELVDTEFGIGRVSAILKDEVWVDIKGMGKVRVPKATAWIITNPIAIQGIEKTLSRSTIIRTPPGVSDKTANVIQGVREVPVAPSMDDSQAGGKIKLRLKTFKDTRPPEPEVAPEAVVPEETPQEKIKLRIKAPEPLPKKKYDRFDEDEDEDVENSIEIFGEIIDGQIALTCSATDNDSDMLKQDYEFESFGDFLGISVKTSQALAEVLDLLSDKFTIRDEFIDNFDVYKDLLKSKKLGVARPQDFAQSMRFFKQQQKTRIKEGFLRPFPLVWGERLIVCIDINSTPSVRKASQAVRAANINGARIVKSELTSNIHVKYFRDANEAIEELGQISKQVEVPNLEDTVDFLKSVKRAPSKTVEKPAKAAPEPVKPKTLIRFKDNRPAKPEPVKNQKIILRPKKR